MKPSTPAAVAKAREFVNAAKEKTVAKLADAKPWIADEEKEAFLEAVKGFESWLDEKEAQQSEKSLTETPAFTAAEVVNGGEAPRTSSCRSSRRPPRPAAQGERHRRRRKHPRRRERCGWRGRPKEGDRGGREGRRRRTTPRERGQGGEGSLRTPPLRGPDTPPPPRPIRPMHGRVRTRFIHFHSFSFISNAAIDGVRCRPSTMVVIR